MYVPHRLCGPHSVARECSERLDLSQTETAALGDRIVALDARQAALASSFGVVAGAVRVLEDSNGQQGGSNSDLGTEGDLAHQVARALETHGGLAALQAKMRATESAVAALRDSLDETGRSLVELQSSCFDTAENVETYHKRLETLSEKLDSLDAKQRDGHGGAHAADATAASIEQLSLSHAHLRQHVERLEKKSGLDDPRVVEAIRLVHTTAHDSSGQVEELRRELALQKQSAASSASSLLERVELVAQKVSLAPDVDSMQQYVDSKLQEAARAHKSSLQATEQSVAAVWVALDEKIWDVKSKAITTQETLQEMVQQHKTAVDQTFTKKLQRMDADVRQVNTLGQNLLPRLSSLESQSEMLATGLKAADSGLKGLQGRIEHVELQMQSGLAAAAAASSKNGGETDEMVAAKLSYLENCDAEMRKKVQQILELAAAPQYEEALSKRDQSIGQLQTSLSELDAKFRTLENKEATLSSSVQVGQDQTRAAIEALDTRFDTTSSAMESFRDRIEQLVAQNDALRKTANTTAGTLEGVAQTVAVHTEELHSVRRSLDSEQHERRAMELGNAKLLPRVNALELELEKGQIDARERFGAVASRMDECAGTVGRASAEIAALRTLCEAIDSRHESLAQSGASRTELLQLVDARRAAEAAVESLQATVAAHEERFAAIQNAQQGLAAAIEAKLQLHKDAIECFGNTVEALQNEGGETSARLDASQAASGAVRLELSAISDRLDVLQQTIRTDLDELEHAGGQARARLDGLAGEVVDTNAKLDLCKAAVEGLSQATQMAAPAAILQPTIPASIETAVLELQRSSADVHRQLAEQSAHLSSVEGRLSSEIVGRVADIAARVGELETSVADLPEALRIADLADRVQSLDTALAALQVAVTKRLLVAESQLCSIETKLLVPPPHARVVDELLRDLHGLKAALVLLQQKVDEVETRQGPSISMRDQLDLAGAVQRISNDLSKISTAVKRLDTSVRELQGLQVSRGPSALPKLAPASSTVAALTGLPDTDAAVEPPPDESARAASAQLAAAQAGGSVVEGVCVATLEGHREAVFQCCYSPSGATVLSSSQVRAEAFIGWMTSV